MGGKAIEGNSFVTDVVKVKNTKQSVSETIMTSLSKRRHLARNRGFSMASVFRVSLAELGSRRRPFGANYLYKVEPMHSFSPGHHGPGGWYLTKFNTGRFRPEVQPLPFYIPFLQKRHPFYIPLIENRIARLFIHCLLSQYTITPAKRGLPKYRVTALVTVLHHGELLNFTL